MYLPMGKLERMWISDINEEVLKSYHWPCTSDTLEIWLHLVDFIMVDRKSRVPVDICGEFEEDEAVVYGCLVPNDRCEHMDDLPIKFKFKSYSIDFAQDDNRGLWLHGEEGFWYKLEGFCLHKYFIEQSQAALSLTKTFLNFFDFLVNDNNCAEGSLASKKAKSKLSIEELFEQYPDSFHLDYIINHAGFFHQHLSASMVLSSKLMKSIKVCLFLKGQYE